MVPLIDLIEKRRSIFSFSQQPVEEEKLISLFEAARWSPSSQNIQPWRFIYATKENPLEFERLYNCLADGNKRWAIDAAVLVLSLTETITIKKNSINKYAWHDTGISTGLLIMQAISVGLSVHTMGGFDPEMAKKVLSIPQPFEPVAMIAIGYKGNSEDLPEDLFIRETNKRTRKPLEEFVFKGMFNANS